MYLLQWPAILIEAENLPTRTLSDPRNQDVYVGKWPPLELVVPENRRTVTLAGTAGFETGNHQLDMLRLYH